MNQIGKKRLMPGDQVDWLHSGLFRRVRIVAVSRADDGGTFCEIQEGGDMVGGRHPLMTCSFRVSIRELWDIETGEPIAASVLAPVVDPSIAGSAPLLQVRRLRPDAVIPRRMSALASGLDLCAAIDEPIRIDSGRWAPIGTGIAVAIGPGHEGQVRPRSGWARRLGVTVLNAPGTIDADYRGEVVVILVNHGLSNLLVFSGERIAQLVICPVAIADPVEVDDLPVTDRGAAGFGSTGH